MNYSVRKLDEEHYLEFFETTTSSGEGTELGEWLQTKAREYQKLHRSVVWIMGDADDPEDVIGYFTLSGYQITGGSLRKRLRSGIEPSQTHPAHLLGKFALRTEGQGKGMGNCSCWRSSVNIVMWLLSLEAASFAYTCGTRNSKSTTKGATDSAR